MCDVFISYANEDKNQAREIVNLLKLKDWEIWWDHYIPAGADTTELITQKLQGAKSVVVLWSENSVPKFWVNNEARSANKRQVLVPVKLDDIDPPLEFDHIKPADLRKWHGDPWHPEFVKLVYGISKLVAPEGELPGFPEDPAPGSIPPEQDNIPNDAGARREIKIWLRRHGIKLIALLANVATIIGLFIGLFIPLRSTIEKKEEFDKGYTYQRDILEDLRKQNKIPPNLAPRLPSPQQSATGGLITLQKEGTNQFLVNGEIGEISSNNQLWIGIVSGIEIWPQLGLPPGSKAGGPFRITIPPGIDSGAVVLLEAGSQSAAQLKEFKANPYQVVGLPFAHLKDIRVVASEPF